MQEVKVEVDPTEGLLCALHSKLCDPHSQQDSLSLVVEEVLKTYPILKVVMVVAALPDGTVDHPYIHGF